MLQVCGLVLARRVFVAYIDHAVVVAHSKTCAVDVEPLAELVLVIEAVLSDLDLNTGSFILDIKALIKKNLITL